MSVLLPGVRDSAIARVNPVAKMIAALLLSLTLLLSVDVVSAAVALVLEGVLFFWAGLGARQFFLRTSPLWVAAPLAGLTMVLYGEDSGRVYFEFLFVTVTQGSSYLGAAMVLRVLAAGMPAIVLFVTADPTDFADGLAQLLKLPSRFVLGGLAGLRLVGLFLEDWRFLALARRARGVGDRGRFRRLGGQAFALLVLSVRRGSKLATAMEAKGFGSRTKRTWARLSRFALPELTLIAVALLVAGTAVTVSVATGSWHFIVQ